jgi:5'-3' exonuclease
LHVRIHLIDGTFELFRAFYGSPSSTTADGRERGAVRGLLRSLLALLGEPDVTHIAIAFDHVIESFRNDLYAGYKTSDGIDPNLWAQFGPAEDATRALGVVTWPMIDFEADDALASAAARFADAPGVEQVVICSPDKDLAQCVRGTRVVCLDRIRRRTRDEAGVHERFGVPPASIPDWLALVGDSADGYPGIPRWGETSAGAVLGASALAESLRANRDDVLLFRRLATLRTDAPLAESLDALRWRGPDDTALAALAGELGDADLLERARQAALRHL